MLVLGALFTKKIYLIIISTALYGFFSVTLLPLNYELSCEEYFPIGESQVVGTMMMFGNSFSVILILIFTETIDQGTNTSQLYVAIGVIIFLLI